MAVLDIPPLAVTNAASDPAWVHVPTTRFLFARPRFLWLPLDPRSAIAARRHVRLTPFFRVAVVLQLIAVSVSLLTSFSSHVHFAAFGVFFVLGLVVSYLQRGMIRQRPFRLRSGDVRIPGIPLPVAEEWVARNPGVTTTDEPVRPRRFYARWSIGLLTASIALVAVMAFDNREDYFIFWMAAPGLFVGGLLMAVNAQNWGRTDEPKYKLLG